MRNSVIEEDMRVILAAPLPWTYFDGKTVLVTGANGFLPAYMLETLLYRNESLPVAQCTRVIALVRNVDRAAARFAVYLDRPDLSFLVQDVCQPLNLSVPIDVIIHAASQASPRYFYQDPVGTILPNTLGLYQVLTLAQSRRIPVLFFSSAEVYGNLSAAVEKISENDYGALDPTLLRSCYGESKRLGEAMCMAWHAQYKVPVSILRIFHTYGPGMRLDDGRVFADFVADIVHSRDIQLKSRGDAQRAFCYLADAVIGFFTVLLRGETANAYNIGNDDALLSITQLAETLCSLFPERGLRVTTDSPPAAPSSTAGSGQSICPDTTKIRALGWAPTTGIHEGFTRTVRSFT